MGLDRRRLGYRIAEVNGGPALLVTSGETPVAVLILDLEDVLVRTVTMIANPDKLGGVRRPPGGTPRTLPP